jgi:hypothetical protein
MTRRQGKSGTIDVKTLLAASPPSRVARAPAIVSF